MKASELRIGNYVDQVNRSGEVHLPIGGIFKVGDIKFFKTELYAHDKPFAIQPNGMSVDICDLSPIPLTPEWLERFGFSKNGGKYNLNEVTYNDGVEIESRYFSDFNHRLDHIKYVHQLQNLYFALTGEELTVKD